MAGSIIRNKPVQTHQRLLQSHNPPTLLSVTPAKNNTRLIIFICFFRGWWCLLLGDCEHCLIPGHSFFLPHFLLFDSFLDGGLHVTINL